MYCPNCGNQNSREQKYCRACGLALEKVAQSLTEHLPTELEKSLAERKEKLERAGVISLSVFGLGVLSFLLYHLFTKLMLTKGPLLAAFILLVAVIILGSGLLSVILFARAKELKEKPKPLEVEEPKDVASPPTSKLLHPQHEPVFGVTERTTDLLTVEKVRKTVDDR
jgi:hypothetical protein